MQAQNDFASTLCRKKKGRYDNMQKPFALSALFGK